MLFPLVLCVLFSVLRFLWCRHWFSLLSLVFPQLYLILFNPQYIWSTVYHVLSQCLWTCPCVLVLLSFLSLSPALGCSSCYETWRCYSIAVLCMKRRQLTIVGMASRNQRLTGECCFLLSNTLKRQCQLQLRNYTAEVKTGNQKVQ